MKIYILNTLGIGLDTTELLSAEVEISGLIGLSERAETDAISGYVYQAEFCKHHAIPFIPVKSYTLKDPDDRKRIEALDIDVLIVAGWQRLIPDWLIDHCKFGAIGAHGSPYGITAGRGRSPQNWSFILGEKQFYISIFKIDPGIDSGDIIETASYPFSVHDDIRTSYYKVSWLISRMLIRAVKSGAIEHGRFQQQEDEQAYYLPQRLPEDGVIDWNLPATRIYDFVRALTKPYPGAWSKLNGQRVRIWRAIPFQVDEPPDAKPGMVIKVFNRDDVLVATGENLVLIESMTFEDGGELSRVQPGDCFESASFHECMQAIIDRHHEKHPDLPLAKPILRASDPAKRDA